MNIVRIKIVEGRVRLITMEGKLMGKPFTSHERAIYWALSHELRILI